MLHGAGGDAAGGLAPFHALVDQAGLVLLAPESRESSWDVVYTDFGPDVAVIAQALVQTFAHVAIAPEHLALVGFSDGASYALSLGVTNGDLFSHLIAFSPGFWAPAGEVGRPAIFVAHGTQDRVRRTMPSSTRSSRGPTRWRRRAPGPRSPGSCRPLPAERHEPALLTTKRPRAPPTH
jgi:phospholipase/carboxylesterase